jgi:serine/threonine-protein kinase
MTQADSELKRRAEGRVGSLLRDKWRIDALLGIGGMAAVYSATHRNGKRGAVKILHAEAALSPDVRARFLREGYLANKVEHPGAVSILDDDVDVDGTVFLVMELLHGQTLESAREHAAIAPADLLLVAHHVLDVLVAAHGKHIVHRDLKPANVFVCRDGSVKILDFGIARLHGALPVPTGGTGRDTALGTPGYMPPEQARGRWDEVDGQSDLWSLGATLFAAQSGRPVHQAPTLNEQLLAAMTMPAPPLASVAPGVPEPLAALVDRALAFDKAERFVDAAAMQLEVARVYETLTHATLTAAPPLGLARHVASVRPDTATLAASNHAVPNRERAAPRRAVLWPGAFAGAVAALLFGVIGFVTRSNDGATGTPASATQSARPPAAGAMAASSGILERTGTPAVTVPNGGVTTPNGGVTTPNAGGAATVTTTGSSAAVTARAITPPHAHAKPEPKAAPSARPATDPFVRRK